jgi:DNA-binding winged helix-turn-helix (wHTH) protein
MFKLDFGSRQLFEHGREVHLQEQPMRLLMLLLDRPGDLHMREELRKQLWPDNTFVEFDDGLNTAIQKIRQVLGDEARNPRFVETVPRQGYRFIAPVQFESNGVIPAPSLEVIHPRPPEPVLARQSLPWRIDWRWAAVSVLVGFGIAWLLPRASQPPASHPLRLSITPPPGVELRPGIRGGSAISRDGGSIVFAGTRDGKHQLWVRQLNSLEARPLAGTEDAVLPFWSPDGKSIGFQSAGKIRRIDLSGGSPIELATATRPTRGAWTDDGFILFATGTGGPIQRVKATGGSAAAASTPGALWPHLVAGSGRFLYFNNSSRKIELASLYGSDRPASLFAADTAALYSVPHDGQPGYLLWLKGSTLMAQAFDPSSASLSGDAFAVAEGVGFAERSRHADLSVSDNGVLLYGAGNTTPSRLAWVRRDGSIAEYIGEQDWLRSVRLTADGRRALIERGMPRALWIFDFDRSLFTRATFEPVWSGWPVWSPDGEEIAYSAARESVYTRGRLREAARSRKWPHRSSTTSFTIGHAMAGT